MRNLTLIVLSFLFLTQTNAQTINVVPSSLPPFTAGVGMPSSIQTYTLSAQGLTTNLDVNAPAGFEIATAAGGPFSSSLVFTLVADSVPTSAVYVRMNSSTLGANSGNIIHSSTGATTQNVSVTGTTYVNEGWSIAATNTLYKIDFDNTNLQTNNGAFAGVGAAPNPAVGELNSNAISVNQNQPGGAAIFGGTVSDGNGLSPGNISTPGFYSFEHTPGNRAFGVKVSQTVWNPGTLTFRVKNNTGVTITKLNIGYNMFIRNDANSWTYIYKEHSADNVTYSVVPGIIHDTAATDADAVPTWKKYFRSFHINVSIAPGDYYYLRWRISDFAHVPPTDWDEIAFDDIQIVANPTTVFPGLAGTYQDLRIQSRTALSGATTVVNYIHLLDTLETGDHTLTLQGIILPGANRYVRTNGTGSITINNIVGSRTIQIGNNTYNPITISNGNGLNWTLSVRDQVIPAQTEPDTSFALQKTWNITPSVTPLPSPTNITFTYNDGDPSQVGTNFNENQNVNVWRHDGAFWVLVAGNIPPTGSPGGLRTVTLPNWSLFSPFTIATTPVALPVKFGEVKATRVGQNIQVAWANLTEHNVLKYKIQRSADGISFDDIGEQVALINNGGRADYSKVDGSPLLINYYRIVAIEVDGNKVISQVVKVNPKYNSPLVIAYPNPVSRNSQVNLNLSNLSKGDYLVKIRTINGQEVHREIINYDGGVVAIPLRWTAKNTGIYSIEIKGVDDVYRMGISVK